MNPGFPQKRGNSKIAASAKKLKVLPNFQTFPNSNLGLLIIYSNNIKSQEVFIS
jgi:hypothetical protein